MKKTDQSKKAPHIAVVYCHNTISHGEQVREGQFAGKGFSAYFAALPCSSKIEPSYLLKLLADGADGVVVVACPESHCRFMVGNVRAEKRINYVLALLDQIDLGGNRIALERGENLTAKDLQTLAQRHAEVLKYKHGKAHSQQLTAVGA